MTDEHTNERLAKNTLLLYFRMLLLMLIGLYTSRVILRALGIEDYGIYNVVGGIVAMFTMISGSLSSAISRFITFELGLGNINKVRDVFSTSVTVQMLLSLIFIFFAETIGLWFLNTQIVIPEERIVAANYVFQFSVITFVTNLISIPYNAAIIAHEYMKAFAYISILEAVFKLVTAWVICMANVDRLIFYAGILAVVAIIIRIVCGWYCKKHFAECTYRSVYDRDLLKKMFGFAGWNLIGATSSVCRDHGGNIVLNLFFGPTVNAARGIAIQVNSAVRGLVSNFQMALNPQITKSYAADNLKYMHKLIFQGARFSYYILFIITLPIIVSTDYILSIWLGSSPEYTALFLKLVLIFSLLESLSGPLLTSMYATGIVRNYQIIVGGLQMLNLPISYVCLCWGAGPEAVFIIAIVLSVICLVARLIMLKPLIQISIKQFFDKVFFNVVLVSIISAIIPVMLSYYIEEKLLSVILLIFTSLFCPFLAIWYIGLSFKERSIVVKRMSNIIKTRL